MRNIDILRESSPMCVQIDTIEELKFVRSMFPSIGLQQALAESISRVGSPLRRNLEIDFSCFKSNVLHFHSGPKCRSASSPLNMMTRVSWMMVCVAC
jgi:hypothetical protein